MDYHLFMWGKTFFTDVKGLGFRTFDKFIDESYDDVKDNYDRLESIAKGLIDYVVYHLKSYMICII